MARISRSEQTFDTTSFTPDQITEAFEGVLQPEAVADVLRRYDEQRRAGEAERVRMERMVNVITAYDELLLLDVEGGNEDPRPEPIMDAASDYLVLVKNKEVIDEVDAKARLASLYVIASLDGPYQSEGPRGELENVSAYGVSLQQITELLQTYVVAKFGPDAWQPDYNGIDLVDLFEEMRHLDGEPTAEVIKALPLFEDIKQLLDEQGFAV